MAKQQQQQQPATTAVAQTKGGPVGQVIDYGDYTGQGFEHQTRDDIAIPFLGVLQALSPELETVDGAKAGMLFNTVTEEVIDGKEGVLFVPCVTQHVYVEWVPRAQGGGFVGIHSIDSEVVKAAREGAATFGKYKNGENDLIETFYIYGVMAEGEDPIGMAVIAFTSTKIKVYKKYNTKIRTYRVKLADGRLVPPPIFAHLTRIKTIKEKNNKGEFYNFQLEPANGTMEASLLPTSDRRFLAAVEVKKMVESGAARASFETQAKAADEDIPF